jgi:hypothetical protein
LSLREQIVVMASLTSTMLAFPVRANAQGQAADLNGRCHGRSEEDPMADRPSLGRPWISGLTGVSTATGLYLVMSVGLTGSVFGGMHGI